MNLTEQEYVQIIGEQTVIMKIMEVQLKQLREEILELKNKLDTGKEVE